MKKEKKVKRMMIGITIAIIILIVVAVAFYKITGMNITIIAKEKGMFEIIGGKVTREYILIGIQNIGTENYFINEINITNCGKIAGENITPNNGIKIFSIPCDNLLERDIEFEEDLTITYSGEDFNNQTQKTIIFGNVSLKRCVYEIYNEQIPVVMNECIDRGDCTEQAHNVRDNLNEKRKSNNQSEINLEDITVLDCSY